MAKPFVICHGEEIEERDRIALVVLICARVCLYRSRALYFHYYVSLDRILSLSFHRSIRQQCGERGELCVICSKIAAIIAGRLVLLASSNGHRIQ